MKHNRINGIGMIDRHIDHVLPYKQSKHIFNIVMMMHENVEQNQKC